MRTSTRTAALFSILAFAAVACKAQDSGKNLVETASANKNLSSLVELVSKPEFSAIPTLLTGNGSYTLFAPSNEAFADAKIDTSDVEAVTSVLLYHVLEGKVASGDLKDKQFPRTLLKNATYVNLADNAAQVLDVTKKDNTTVTVSTGVTKANVTTADLQASNGVIHIIDKILLPPKKPSDAVTDNSLNFTTFTSLLKKANLVQVVDELKNVTIFVPTDDAFKKVSDQADKLTDEQLKDVLKYHIVQMVAYSTDVTDGASLMTVQGDSLKASVQGANVTVNGANVVVPDVLTSNGVIHGIDAVLLPASVTNGTNGTNGTGSSSGSSNSGSNQSNQQSGSSIVGQSIFAVVLTASAALGFLFA